MPEAAKQTAWWTEAWILIEPWVGLLVSGSLLLLLVSIVVIPLILVRLPADYFVNRRPPSTQRGAQALFALVIRNTLAIILILIGMIMFMLPGPGILVVLAGIALSTFPGKYRLERAIVRRRPVFRAINWIRANRNQPPMRYPYPRSLAEIREDSQTP